MSFTVSGTLSSKLDWNLTDLQSQGRITDIGSVAVEFDFASGSGTGQVNNGYSKTNTLPSGGREEFDLLALTRQIFNATLNVSFTSGRLHALIVNNLSPTGIIYIRATGTAAFNGIFNGGTGDIPIYPLSNFNMNNVLTGFPVSTGQRFFQIHDGGLGCEFSIGLLGRTGVA